MSHVLVFYLFFTNILYILLSLKLDFTVFEKCLLKIGVQTQNKSNQRIFYSICIKVMHDMNHQNVSNLAYLTVAFVLYAKSTVKS